jgi:hypothetical protein
MASGESLPILEEALVKWTLGWNLLSTWVFITIVTSDLILGLDVMHALAASVDLRHHMLRLGKEEVPLGCDHIHALV